MENGLVQTLNGLGLDTKWKGPLHRNLYTTKEIADKVSKYGLQDDVNQIAADLIGKTDPARAHELLHCFDVGFGAAELVEQIAQDKKAMEKLGVTEINEDYVKSAVLSGLFHDLILAFRGDDIEEATPIHLIRQAITDEEAKKLQCAFGQSMFEKGPVQYTKDSIGDDLRGAILLYQYRDIARTKAGELAIAALLDTSELEVKAESGRRPLIGNFNPHKILDAIWYHDGNYPIRGHAEADAIIGDRITLCEQGRIGINAVDAGIEKLMGYTEQDPNWANRSDSPDIAYLKKMITKKAGNFLETIEGTQTYGFVVEDLASRRRGHRTLESDAFWAGVDKMPEVLKRAEAVKGLGEHTKTLVGQLHQRYEEIQHYRSKD